MRGQRRVIARQAVGGQLSRDLGLGGQAVGLGQAGGTAAQASGQRTPATAQHRMQRRAFTAPRAAEPGRDQDRDLVGHDGDVFEAVALAHHQGRIDGMAAARQTP